MCHLQDLPIEFVRKAQSAFLDGLYSFLDGLVHVAFSDQDAIYSTPAPAVPQNSVMQPRGEDGRPNEVDVSSVVSFLSLLGTQFANSLLVVQDTRILLTVSNLTYLRTISIPRMVNQFQAAFKVDMGPEIEMLMSVTDQLDKILFDDYVKRKSMEVAKIITKGVLGGAINWYEAPKPTGKLSFELFSALKLSNLQLHSCRGSSFHL